MNTQRKKSHLLGLALVLVGCMLIPPAVQARASSSQEVRELLAQVKAEAITLERDAEMIAAWGRAGQVSWRTHANQLNLMRRHINQAGELLTRLNDVRHEASPWQQKAIDRIHPVLKELADNTSAMINHLNMKENRERIGFRAYREYTKAGAELANKLAAVVSDYVEYGEREAEFHQMQDKIETTGS